MPYLVAAPLLNPREILGQYVSSRTWLLGTMADLSGALLMIVAFAHAPVGTVLAGQEADCQPPTCQTSLLRHGIHKDAATAVKTWYNP